MSEALKCFKSTSEGNECLFEKINEDAFPFKAKKIQSLHFLIFASMYLYLKTEQKIDSNFSYA